MDAVRNDLVANQSHDWNGDSGRECQCESCFSRRRQLYLAWRVGCVKSDDVEYGREVWTVEEILAREG